MEKVNAVIRQADRVVIQRILDHLRGYTKKAETIILAQVGSYPGYDAGAKERASQMVGQIFEVFYDALDTIVFVDEPGEHDTIN